MTLNAIFKYPDLYKTAIAVAPVANQRYYDTIYQERYMGLPGDNVEGFLQGSPINFAHQLKGNLLVIHGTGDDNCHYQGTEALINELIRHDKPFTMMAYPNRSHGIYEGHNTTLHLRELMTRYLKQNLPPGPDPEASRERGKERGEVRAIRRGTTCRRLRRRRMTLLDAILLVGSAAVGLGLSSWLIARSSKAGSGSPTGHPDFRTWSTMRAIVTLYGHHGVHDTRRDTMDVLLFCSGCDAAADLAADLAAARHGGMPGCPFGLVWTSARADVAMNVGIRISPRAKPSLRMSGCRNFFPMRSSCTSAWPWRPFGWCNSRAAAGASLLTGSTAGADRRCVLDLDRVGVDAA